MKLRRLELAAFGPFTGKTLDFGDGGGLTLVTGPNEAGKSSALRGLRQLLYGIPARSTDDFVHAYKDMELRGVIDFADGQNLELRRKKGNKNTLVELPSVEAVSQERLKALMGGVGEETFTRLFAIDHHELSAGGEQVLRSGGALGQSLFAAASGIAGLRDILERLEEEQKALFAPRATKTASISAAMGRLQELRRDQREASAAPSAWKALVRDVKRLEKQRTDLQDRLAALTSEAKRLKRFEQALVPARLRLEARKELEGLADAPVLGPDFTARRTAAVTGHAAAKREADAMRTKLAELDEALSHCGDERALVDAASVVEGLHAATGIHDKALRDAKNLETQCERLREQAAELLRGLRPDLTLDDVEELRLSRQDQSRIQALVRQSAALEAQGNAADRELRSLALRLEEARRTLANLPEAPDTASLADAVERAASAGDVETRRDEALAATDALRKSAESAASALGLWSGTLDELAALPVPSDETMRGFQSRYEALVTARRDAVADEQRAAAAFADADARLDELRRAGDVPDEDALRTARALRDAGWSVVRGRLDGEQDAAAEKDFLQRAEAVNLPDGFEATLRAADDVADRLRREAGRVAENAALEAETARRKAERTAAAERIAAVDADREALRTEWAALWQPLGIEPRPPAEMLAWAEAHRAACRRIDDLRTREAEAATLAARTNALRTELSGLLTAVGDASAPQISLAALLAHARRAVRSADEQRTARRDTARSADDLARDHAEAEANSARIRDDRALWAEQWAAAVRPLGLDASATAEQAEAILADVGQLFTYVAELRDKEKRVRHIRDDYENFRTDVRAMAASVASDLAEVEPVRAARELNDRLSRARTEAERGDQLARQRRETAAALEDAERRMASHNDALALLCSEAACADAEGLEDAERRAAARAAAAAKLAQAEERLAEAAAGADIDEFAAAALDHDPDTLAAEIARLDTDSAALTEELNEVQLQLGGARRDIDAMDGTSRAAQIAEEAQGVAGRVQDDLDRYVRLKLASLLLAREMERWRKANQGPVLERAGGIFAALTCGSFAGLEADFDDKGEPVVQGAREDGTRVPVSGMSDGTNDQLFLALRLAGLHRYLDDNPPLPFVVDDILVNFDDARAAATLGALGDLAARTQVVFFTHHAHLLPLAEAAVPAERLRILRLSD